MTAVNPWVVFAIFSAAVFLVSVDATIAVAAYPALRQSFAEASPSDLSWVLNAYLCSPAADAHLGTDFSLKNEVSRAEVGLVAVT